LWPPWGVTDGIEPGPATAQLMVKASLDGSSDPPDPRRAVCELRQNAMEPSPALAGFFFFGKLARSATPEVATRDRCGRCVISVREHRKPAGAFFPAVYLEFAASALKRPPKEIAPRVTRAAVLRDSANPAGIAQFGAIRAAASSLGGPAGVTHIDRRQLHPRLTCGSNSGLIVTISPAGSASRASD
jgi:hypothetical protein